MRSHQRHQARRSPKKSASKKATAISRSAAEPKHRKKFCHCTPTCKAFIGHQQRQRHYRKITAQNVALMKGSDSGSANSDDNNSSAMDIDAASLSSCIPSLSHSPPRPSRSKKYTVTVEDVTDEEDAQTMDDEHEHSEHNAESDFPTHPDNSSSSDESDYSHRTASDDPYANYDSELDADIPDPSIEELIEELERHLGPQAEEELWKMRNHILTDQDRDNIRAFKLKMMGNLPRDAFDEMRYTFSHKMDISSEWVILARIAILTGIEPVWIDCCVNSCIAYTKHHTDATHCPHCKEPRRTPGPASTSRPRRQFPYLPLIPRLQGYFSSLSMIDKLSYRNAYVHDGETISDVFDGLHYRQLLDTTVEIDGIPQDHKFFSHPHDIALSTSFDSFVLFKRRRVHKAPSATPILLQNYNLPPEIRTHLEHLLCVGLVPGPHGPVEADTFLAPLDDEFAKLARGVSTFDAKNHEIFELHAYDITEIGDMVAMEKYLNIKGHNGIHPCRSCEITAVRDVNQPKSHHYPALMQPKVRGEPYMEWDPHELPLRSHESFQEAVDAMDEATTKADRDGIAKNTGIKGLPAFVRVNSHHFGRSTPHDWMHLFLENVIPNLVRLWSGAYKGLDVGTGDYEIPDAVWQEIGCETADAVKDIPSAFVRSLGNIAIDKSSYTAEAWGFWFMYLAPILLKDRFPNQKYYVHACDLVDIMKTSIEFSLKFTEIDRLEEKIIKWVREYEKYYYQYQADRLSACPLTIHALLHVPDDIRFCGPTWTAWSFWVERFCGSLQSALRSKSRPYANLNKRILHIAYLAQLRSCYNLEDELSTPKTRKANKQLSQYEKLYDGYPMSVMRPPYDKSYTPDMTLRRKIAGYFSAVLGKAIKNILPQLPAVFPSWGNARILHGDTFRTGSVSGRSTQLERDMSFVRYEIEVQDLEATRRHHTKKKQWMRQVFYGRLELIIISKLPETEFWGTVGGEHILAVITPCKTNGLDATKQLTFYNTTTTPIVTNIQTIVAVIGRVKTRGKWGIIDRSNGLAKPVFTPDIEVSDSENDDSS